MTNDATSAEGGGIAAVIVNFRQERFLPALFDSLACQTLPPAATILVQNGPSLFAPPAGVEVVTLPRNRGYAAGVNAGLLRALGLGCGAALILNADTRLDPRCLAFLADAPGDIVQPLVLLAGDPGRINVAGLKPTRLGVAYCMRYRQRRAAAGETPVAIPAASGAAMLVRREAIDRTGLFDESFFLYLEDVDYSLRAQASGCAVMLEPRAVVWHHYRWGLGLRKWRYLWCNARVIRRRFGDRLRRGFTPR